MNLKLKNFAYILFSILSLIAFIGCDGNNHDSHENHNNFVITSMRTPYIYVVNGADNNISIVDQTQFKEVGKFYLKNSNFPHHIYSNGKTSKRTQNYEGSLLAVAITGKDLSGGHGGHSDETKNTDYKVLVLDSFDGTVIKEIKLDKSPHNAIFKEWGEGPHSEELWISQYDERNSFILIYDTKNWTKIDSIPVGSGLSEVTFDYKGHAFATNTLDGTVDIIKVDNRLKLKTLKVGQNPVGAWNGVNYMLVDNEKSQTITIINKKSLEIEETIDLGYTPAYAIEEVITYDEIKDLATTRIWVTNTAGYLVGYDKIDNIWTKTKEIPTGAGAHAITHFHSGYFVTNQEDNSISMINLLNNTTNKTKVGNKPNGLVYLWNPVGR